MVAHSTILQHEKSLLDSNAWIIVQHPTAKKQMRCSIYIYTWNPNDPCFDWKGPCFGGLKPKNRGQIGSRYIYIYLSLFLTTQTKSTQTTQGLSHWIDVLILGKNEAWRDHFGAREPQQFPVLPGSHLQFCQPLRSTPVPTIDPADYPEVCWAALKSSGLLKLFPVGESIRMTWKMLEIWTKMCAAQHRFVCSHMVSFRLIGKHPENL